jgi:hypothetical protein
MAQQVPEGNTFIRASQRGELVPRSEIFKIPLQVVLNGDLDYIKSLSPFYKSIFKTSLVRSAFYFGHLHIAEYFFKQYNFIPPMQQYEFQHSFKLLCINLNVEFVSFAAVNFDAMMHMTQDFILQALVETIEDNDLNLKLEDLLDFMFNECEVEVAQCLFIAAGERQNIIDFLNEYRDSDNSTLV